MKDVTHPAGAYTASEVARSIVRAWSFLRARKRQILALGFAGASAGIAASFLVRAEYASSLQIVPYVGNGPASGISNLAGLAGIRISAGGADDPVNSEVYPAIVSSPKFLLNISRSHVWTSFSPEPLAVSELLLGDTSKSIVGRAAGSIKRALALPSGNGGSRTNEPRLAVLDSLGVVRVSDAEDALVDVLRERVRLSVDRRTGIIGLTAEMPDPIAAANTASLVAQRLMNDVIEMKAKKAREERLFIAGQHEIAKSAYESAQQRLAAFIDRNRALTNAALQVERDRLTRDQELAFEVYQTMSRELQQSRIREQKDTPVFASLGEAPVPTKRQSPNRLAFAITGFMLAFLGLITRDFIRLWPNFEPERQ